MSALDEITAAVTNSERLDAGTKAVLGDFLKVAGPALANVAAETVNDLLRSVAGGDTQSAVEALSEALSPEQVVATLQAMDDEMRVLVQTQGASVVAAQTIIDAAAGAALQILVRVILAAI